MNYIYVSWKHSAPDEPVVLYSELDEERWEVRKVEIFMDGHKDYAGESDSSGSLWLGEAAVPGLEEINSSPEFEASEISRAEFEKIWESRLVA